MLLKYSLTAQLVFGLLFLLSACSQQAADPEYERLQARAQNVTIIRDDFGVPHIYAKSDADAVFGMLYAQSEDDFNRVEQNYIWATGRLTFIAKETTSVSLPRFQMTEGLPRRTRAGKWRAKQSRNITLSLQSSSRTLGRRQGSEHTDPIQSPAL